MGNVQHREQRADILQLRWMTTQTNIYLSQGLLHVKYEIKETPYHFIKRGLLIFRINFVFRCYLLMK